MPLRRLISAVTALASTACVALVPALPFEDEKLAFPVDEAVVGTNFSFFIQASGVREKDDFYRIDISADPDFEQIIQTYDSREKKTGWRYSGQLGGIDLPKSVKEDFSNQIGVLLRTRLSLADGEYYWRAFKARGGGAWEDIGDTEQFYLDGVPPDNVEKLRMWIDERGRLAMDWSPPLQDLEGGDEAVSGYRIYRYTKLLKRYPVITRFLVGETESTNFAVDLEDEEGKIVFYRVQAVDVVGNEEGRRRPAPMGAFATQFDPPNLDQLTDPEYLRQANAEFFEEEQEEEE